MLITCGICRKRSLRETVLCEICRTWQIIVCTKISISGQMLNLLELSHNDLKWWISLCFGRLVCGEQTYLNIWPLQHTTHTSSQTRHNITSLNRAQLKCDFRVNKCGRWQAGTSSYASCCIFLHRKTETVQFVCLMVLYVPSKLLNVGWDGRKYWTHLIFTIWMLVKLMLKSTYAFCFKCFFSV